METPKSNVSPFYFRTGDTGYYLYEVDAGGYEVASKDGAYVLPALVDLLKADSGDENPYTDVIVLSHGYANGKEDDGSIAFGNSVANALDRERPSGVNPLYVAVHWPSVPTTLFHGSAKENEERYDRLVEGDATQVAKTLSEDIGHLQKELKDIEPAAAKKLESVANAASKCVHDQHVHSSAELPKPVHEELTQLAAALSPEASAKKDDACNSVLDDGAKYTDDTNKYVQANFAHATQKATIVSKASERPSFIQALWGKRLSFTIQDIMFGQFERRASVVGSRGVHLLLAKLMEAAAPQVKFHLFGHSLGGHVISAAAIGRKPGSLLTRKIHTLMIAQGAMDSNSYAKGGAYRPVVTHLKPVAGPVLATMSPFDGALKAYDIFHNTPIGLSGIKDARPGVMSVIPLTPFQDGNARAVLKFEGGKFYNLDGKDIITEGKPDILGLIDIDKAHSDIRDPETMHAFWCACITELPQSLYSVVPNSQLPKDYWDNYRIRDENDFSITRPCCTS